MSKPSIVITGAFGFIGSNLVSHLNKNGVVPYVLIRNIGESWHNVAGLSFRRAYSLYSDVPSKATVIHLGANVDTREAMKESLWKNNVDYTIGLQKYVCENEGRFIYASSASVYGAEEKDFSERIDGLKPLNAYGFTKLYLDNYFFGDKRIAKDTYGLRFFNVYGPREDHKGAMASVIHKAMHGDPAILGHSNDQAALPRWCLFKSHRPEFKNGEQARDFVAVSDVCKVISFFADNAPQFGVYNLGSGTATTFNHVVKTINPNISIVYRDMPPDIKDHYQYHTKADLTKLRAAGYNEKFLSIEEGIEEMRKNP